ncbi:MAG: hypothetical protein WCG95_07035, partial [bacterium]
KLLMEFIIAICNNKKYIKQEISDFDLVFLEKRLFEIFGLELKDRKSLYITITKRKKEKAVALKELADSLNNITTYIKPGSFKKKK